MPVPDVPDPLPDPLEHIWIAGRRIIRCHEVTMGATEFNTSDVSRRFRPIRSKGAVVPIMYGADLIEGALSETVFHDVPVRGPARRIQHKALVRMIRSTIIPRRDLRLVRLHGAGLGRLGVTHGELIETGSSQYERTALWGQALHELGSYDGLVWRSRQFNDSFALMLWGDHIDRFLDLEADPDNPPLLLYGGVGFDEVQQLADDVGVTIIS